MAKVNKHIQRTFGEILHEEADVPADVLVTISRVETTPNLKSATIWLYISPSSKEEEVLEILKPQMYELQGALNRALTIHPLPRLYLKADHGAHHAQTIEQKLVELKEDTKE
ncbi:MAG: ribosome-binding factor A [Candidatus Andersenbacteria bacterium]